MYICALRCIHPVCGEWQDMRLMKVFKTVEDSKSKSTTHSAEIGMEADVDEDEALDQMWLASSRS